MRIEAIMMQVVLAASIAMASCGADTGPWPSCRWPATLDPDPSGSARDHCVASRTILSCVQPSGAGEVCTTNDPDRCEGGDLPDSSCHAECARDEFVAACGGVGPGPIPAPPAGCHGTVSVPSGVVFYCCPCGA